MINNTIRTIYTSFKPNRLAIDDDLADLAQDVARTNLLIYGEIHGIVENAHVVYSLIQKLKIKQLAIECDSKTVDSILRIAESDTHLDEIDSDIYDSSIISIEMLKSIVTALRNEWLDGIVSLDTYYDEKRAGLKSSSANEREAVLAKNILTLNLSSRTMCIMGRWHTKTSIVERDDRREQLQHVSAYLRIAKKIDNVTNLEITYGSGAAYNCGEHLSLPKVKEPIDNGLRYVEPYVYKLHIAKASPIEAFESHS